MFFRQSIVPVFEIHSHFLHGTWECNQGHMFEFSTNLYALEHVHVVQIWIMHINALKTQLMHKNVQTNTAKIDTTLLLFYVDTRKIWKQ